MNAWLVNSCSLYTAAVAKQTRLSTSGRWTLARALIEFCGQARGMPNAAGLAYDSSPQVKPVVR